MIKMDLLTIYNSMLRNRDLFPTQAQCTIVCMPKNQASPKMNDCRTLTLFNTDHKN
jgi:hypothetical protein